MYEPGSFTPLLRVETENTELAKTRHRSLAEKLEQEGSGDGEAVQFPAALRAMLDRLEDELRRNAVSEESRAWLTQCGLTVEQMKNQLEPRPEPERKVHLYHCDHRGLPLALISPDNTVAWRAEYDEWGNQLSEGNPEHLEQLIRLPGQQYDEESGLHYNRHRYYSPGQGRYITQDPAGLEGGWNLYAYPLNPVTDTDPLGLWQEGSIEQAGPSWFIADPMEKYRQQAAIDLTKWWHDTAPQRDLFLLTQCPEARMIMLAAMNGSTSSTNARQSEYEAYKNRCNQSPPPNLDFCSLAKWKLSRNKDCRDMRQSWDNKWLPGRHAKNIAELDVGINKLAKTIADKCP
ncbi:RHS repeat protein [Salmonella enterica]|nr:RHS repeat protein [Salmonella enterica]EDZ4391675.1 RHS repeat protein [Salmonella enterica]EEH1970199.1 RHS repeat protein [Salmonella enterica]